MSFPTPPLNLNQRLRIVDNRIADVDRRLGDLVTQFFWRQSGVDQNNAVYCWSRLPVWEVKDTGFGGGDADGQSFGSEAKEKQFTVKIDKTWWETHRTNMLRYEYGFILIGGSKVLPCSLLGESTIDAETSTTMQFREVKLGQNFLKL